MWIFLKSSFNAARTAPAIFSRRLSYPCRQSVVNQLRGLDNQSRPRVPWFLSRQLSVSPPEIEDATTDATTGAAAATGAESRYRNKPKPGTETLEERVIRLSDQINRYDRIQIGQVKVLLGEARKTDSLDDPMALLMLRSTGAVLAREQISARQELFHQAWDIIKSKATLNTSHYNAAMRVMIENEEEFDPTQFLAEMDKLPQTKPNRVTYQVMVAKYCSTGDTDAAFKIINHMKSIGMPVNEYIFSSLIKAFVKNGQPEQAREVMSNMRTASLEPSDITYRAILTAYAEMGSLDAIHQTLAEVKKDEVLIKASFFADLGCTAVLNGHKDLLEPILDLLGDQGRFNFNLSNCADKLVASGYDEEAYFMISKMKFTQVQEPEQLGHGKYLIGAMIQCDRPATKIVEMQERLNKTGLNSDTVEDILQRALVSGKTKLAVDLMDIIRKEGNTVTHEDVISLSRNFVKGKDAEGLYEVAREVMKTLDGDRQVISLYLNVVRELVKTATPLEEVLEKLKSLGVAEDVMKGLKIAAKMAQVPVSEVLKEVQPEDIKPSIIKWDVLNIIRASKGKAEEIMQLVNTLNMCYRDQMVDVQNTILLRALQSSVMEGDECAKLVDFMHEKQLRVQDSFKDSIMKNINNSEKLTPELQKQMKSKLQELFAIKFEPVVKVEDMRQMSIEDLEKLLREQKRKSYNTKYTSKRLLIAYCREGNIARVEEIQQTLLQQGFILDAEALRELLSFAAVHKKDVAEAEKYLDLLESQYPDFWRYSAGLIHLAGLYLQQNKVEAAKDLLKSRAEKHQEKYNDEHRNTYTLTRILADLVNVAVDKCGWEVAQELIAVLFHAGYVKEGVYKLVEIPVEGSIRMKDFDGALEALELTLKEYNRVPYFSVIFKHFIKEENSEKLQKAVDLCMTSSMDQCTVLHHLMFRFIENGKLKQASNIAETPGLRANMQLLKDHCSKLSFDGKMQSIHDLVEATRNLHGVDKEEMHFQLIRANSFRKDWQKALDAYIFLEEEGISPRVRTQRYLAKVLQSAGQPVPFQVPEAKQSTNAPGKTSGNEEILEAIKKDDFDTLVKLARRSDNTEKQSSSAEIASLILQSKQLQLLKKVIHGLALEGEVSKVSEISGVLLFANMKKFCSHRSFLAHIKKGTAGKFLEDAAKDPKILCQGSTGLNIVELLKAKPELEQKVEEIAVKATADPGSYEPLAHLVQALFIQHQDDKVSELLQKYPDVKKKINFQSLTRALKDEESDMKRLAEFSLKNLTLGKYKTIMSNLILLRANANDIEGALKYIDEVKDAGIKPEEMWAKPMIMLETLLKENGKPLPWPEGTFKQNNPDISSSSSESSSSGSSSDSSDDESNKNKKSV